MNVTMTRTACWAHTRAHAACSSNRRSAPPQRDLRARFLAYAFAALGLALAAYGERFVLADAKAPIVETAIARCAAELVGASEPLTPACVAEAPRARTGDAT